MPGAGEDTHLRGRTRFQSLSKSGMGGSDGGIQKRQMGADSQHGNGALSKRTLEGLYAGGYQSRDETGFP